MSSVFFFLFQIKRIVLQKCGKQWLTLVANKVSEVLVLFSFQSNRIVKLEGLDGLVKLEELYISDNGIEEIEGLDNLVSKDF